MDEEAVQPQLLPAAVGPKAGLGGFIGGRRPVVIANVQTIRQHSISACMTSSSHQRRERYRYPRFTGYCPHPSFPQRR